jgi:3',5'-cyclic-AMP phosphodiesterase
MTEHLLIQISDVHLTSEGQLFPGARPRENLLAALELLAEAGLAPDLLILTGDLANTGEAACYQDLAEIMDQASGALGGRVVYLPGNHDERSVFRRHLLGQEADLSPINQIHWIDGLRVVSLDSVAVGEEFGELSDETLSFLAEAIAAPAPDGTVLALHHPPIPSPVQPMARIMLRRPERLAEVVAGTDVRLILCGHNHHEALGVLGGVPVWVSPSTAYRMDVLSRQAVRGLPGCSLSQVDLSDGSATVTVIPVPLGSSDPSRGARELVTDERTPRPRAGSGQQQSGSGLSSNSKILPGGPGPGMGALVEWRGRY